MDNILWIAQEGGFWFAEELTPATQTSNELAFKHFSNEAEAISSGELLALVKTAKIHGWEVRDKAEPRNAFAY